MQRLLRYIFPAVCALLTIQHAGAQVINDAIARRLPLAENAPLTSSTIDCTVEWACLNQSLTRSCIKYHNDQWFSLVVSGNKPYFLNVSGQDCRDIWGVQVVVFSGEACEPATYELLVCHSDGNTDDIFIRLPPLEPGREYLVNVDGYLHDLCSFTLELSDEPKGLPLTPADEIRSQVTTDGRIVSLSWELTPDQSAAMEHFEVYRSRGDEQPFELLEQRPHQRNAYGEGRMAYVFSDTLSQTKAEYKVVGQTPGDRLLLLYEEVRIDPQAIRQAPEDNLVITLDYPAGEELAVLIYDHHTDSLLLTDEFVFQPAIHQQRKYYIGPYRQRGIHDYRVVVIRKSTWQRREWVMEK